MQEPIEDDEKDLGVFQEEERFHESIAQPRTSLETLSIWADLALGRKEKLLPN